MDEEERQRKLEAGRAKLASFRQRRAKTDSAGPAKKTQKRKGPDVPQNDRPAQGRPLETVPQTGNDTQQDSRTNHEHPQMSEESDQSRLPKVQQNQGQKEQSPAQERITSLGEEVAAEQAEEELGDKVLVPHTGKEQLKQLQRAVEKRNEIIARLSSNLQEALVSRDQVQQEAQSLAVQIQALQTQLQQTSQYLRSRTQAGPELPQAQQQLPQPGHDSPDPAPLPTQTGSGPQSLQSDSNTPTDAETDALLLGLRTELEEERENNRRVRSELEEERREREEERGEREAQLEDLRTQLSQAQTQCLEIQQHKQQEEALNREVQELRRRLQEEEERVKEEEREREEEMGMLREEVQRVRQLLEVRERAGEERTKEEFGLKASKDKQNQARASVGEEGEMGETGEGSLDASFPGGVDPLMERYLSATVPTRSHSSWANESLEERSLLENSGNYRFELDSEVMDDHSRLSVSHSFHEEQNALHSFSIPQYTAGSPPVREEDDPAPPSPAPWPQNSLSGWGDVSEAWQDEQGEHGEASSDLGKELLIQQCGDLQEELALREREQEVLKEEVVRSADELEEARARWAQVSEELQEARLELEEEKEKRRTCQEEMEEEREKRRRAQEEINVKTHEEDNLKNKLSALLEEKEKERETLLSPSTLPEKGTEPERQLKEAQEEKAVLFSRLKQQELLVASLQEVKLAGDSVTSEVQALFGKQLQSLQAHRDQLLSQLEETKARHKTTAALLGQRTMELDTALKGLDSAREEAEKVQKEMDMMREEAEERERSQERTERERTDLESQLLCLKQNLTNLEEAQAQGAREREAQRRREEELDRQMRKMEEVLDEELEDFQRQLRAKENEVVEEREKWEEELQEKEEEVRGVTRLLEEQRREREEEVRALLERQVLAVEEVTERLRSCHREEVQQLQGRHQEEVSELNASLERELCEQKAALEEEQRRQISLIKQVNEREHQRMISGLSTKQREELNHLKTELSEELRESMEAAHQAELMQTQSQQSLEMEALRLSLTNLHTAQLELSQANLHKDREAALSEVQASLREKWAQESAVLQARQQFELDRIREQSQGQQERQRELHQQDMDDLRQQLESQASREQQQAKDVQALRVQWQQESEKAQTDLQNSLSEAQGSLSETRKCLSETQADLSASRASLEELQASSEKEIQRLEAELNQAWTDRDAAARAVEELVSSHKVMLQEKVEHTHQLEEREKELQQEVLCLQEGQASIRKSSEQEVAHLWAQLDSMRTSRQELGELKEQLLARSSRVDDMERLKAEFNQQRREIQEQNETELENLRRYFEQRLRAAEESYREEITLMQLRLVEGALEDSVHKTADTSFLSEGRGEEEERNDILAEITFKLEKHKEELDCLRVQLEERHTQELSNLRSSMALSYREELLQVRSDLTDRYYSDLQELKTRHALEQEQLRAKLSDSHIRELTRVRLEAARQVEVEVEQRVWCHSEELQTRMTIIQTLESRLSALTQQHTTELLVNTQKLKQESSEELRVHLEQTRKEERERVREEATRSSEEEAQRLREQLHAQEETRVSALRQELERGMEEERRGLERELEEERERLRSLQASLDNDQNPQVVAERQRLEAQFDSELLRAKSCMAAEVKELTALLQEQGEERLCQAQERFQEERGQLEQRLAQQDELSLGELRDQHQADLELQKTTLLTRHAQETDKLQGNHKAELDSLSAHHKAMVDAMATDVDSKHKAELIALETSLESKRKAELDRLEAVLQETNQAQLEALEVELGHRHQEEKEELERRMLGNMDTLEGTYLQEIQTLRDQRDQLEAAHAQEAERERARHKQEVAYARAELGQEAERERAEQRSVREELRRELAQVHMEKFSAMATELSHAHQTELSAQREASEAGHAKALEDLRNKVLELEQQHSAALQELTHAYTTDREQLSHQHQLQLQELKGVSTRELEACRRELDEESSRQHLHFLEEAELLKVQLDERLQQRINQLKVEFEEQKEVELEEQRRSFSREWEQKERSYTDKMSQLTAQLQQLDTVVSQLRAEVGCLQGDVEGKRVEMETLDTLLQRRERESQEGGNLLNMLTVDLQAAKDERRALQLANERLGKTLLEVIRSTVATEELIGRRVSASAGGRDNSRGGAESVKRTTNPGSSGGTGVSVADLSSEDLDMTQRVCESLLLADTLTHSRGEEAALGACSRLRHTVDTLLELLTRANTQLEQTYGIHLSLEERFSQGKEDSAQLLLQHTLLLEQLDQEAGQKSQLQLELHKSEGLLDGYVAEKAVLEEALQHKEAQEERLVEELEGLRAQLHQMEDLSTELEGLRVQHQELSEEHTVFLRQRDHLSAGLGEREKGLLAEAERLARERLDVQRQAEKDRSSLSLRLRAMETELDEQETKGLETELQHKAHAEDLHQRVQALEKQLKHNRQFIDEQAVEREHERDEFQQEIHSLEAQLRHPARGHSTGDNKEQRIEDLVLQVDNLQALIRDKSEDHASLLAANQQAQLDVAERNEEIDKLAGRIRELEQALLSSSESSRAVVELEQELHRVKQREQDLTQDKQALEQQQLSNRLQISALQSKVDETRHRYHDNTPDPTQQLRDSLDTAQQDLQSKERQVEVLVGQLEQVQSNLTIKEAELKHLTLQLEQTTIQNSTHVSQLEDQIDALKETVSTLTIHQEEREGEREEEEEESLASALLQEKNQEIDHLNQEIQRLQQEVESSRDKMAVEAELEDLRSQVEHLHGDIVRLRQDKQEEAERLHEVISTLQAELATLGPVLHEVSDSQEGDSVNPSPSPSPEPPNQPRYAHPGAERRRGEGDSLKQELRLLHTSSSSSSSRSLRARVEALQGQLETAAGEKEALERLLFTQEEEYRGQGEEMGRRLREERDGREELGRLLAVKEAELEEERRRWDEDERVEEWGRQQARAQEMSTLLGEKNRLESLVLELRRGEEEREKETKGLTETTLTLERQVQEARAEVVAMETVKNELFAEREALRRRERQLQEEIERLRQEVTSQTARFQELSLQLEKQGTNQLEDQKEVLTHAEVTLAKADTALRQREAELARLGAEHQALRAELAAVKEGLSSSTERAEKLREEGQTKDRALADLETNNQRLKAELRGLQEDLAVQEEELAYQQRELLHLRQRCSPPSTPPRSQTHPQKDVSLRGFEEAVSVSHDEVSLSSPEVLRRLECSEDRVREGFRTSLLHGSRLSELSALDSPGLDPHQAKASLRGRSELLPRPGSVTPEPATRSTRSPGSVSVSASDNLSMLDSLDAEKVHELENLDLTTPSSPAGSISSLSAPEWASDGYGSNVSSELGLRLRVELEQTERLDAQFIEYLRCRGMNPAANTDSAAGSMSYSDKLLSPELQGLLKRVYQESCRVLALSQHHASSSSQLHLSQSKSLSLDQSLCQSDSKSHPLDERPCPSASAPPLGWQQEKRALQETVIALRELLCRMAQRDTQGDGGVDDEQHLLAVQRESQLRAELEESRQQLHSAHNTQQEQHNKIHTLRLAVEECEEALSREQSRVQQFQQELEQERTHTHRREREEEDRREAVRVSVEQQGSEVVTLRGQLEQETVSCSNLRRELQIEQSRGLLLQSQLDKRLADAHQELDEERRRCARQQDLQSQERSRQEHFLKEAESRLADAHRKLEEERHRCSRQLDDAAHRQEAEAAQDRKFIADLRSQLEQERRQGEELAAVTDRLRAEAMQTRRRGEEEDRRRREETQREQEAAVRLRVAAETLKEQKQEASRAAEAEQERSGRLGAELGELKEKLCLLKEKERERDEQREKERRKERQEQTERERRHKRTSDQLCELELLRQQDQQRVRDLQQTLAELEREERDMATRRLCGAAAAQPPSRASLRPQKGLLTGSAQDATVLLDHQTSSSSSSGLVERLLKENSELTGRVTELSQERVTLKHTLACLERQLRCTEGELAKVTAETENRPAVVDGNHNKVQRLYERYLRAESFRKALVYQKRYLLLLLGGFQDCEHATLGLIARMGAHPSPPVAAPRRALTRFRAAARAVIAVSRLKFLTRKWQRAIRRGVCTTVTVNGYTAGSRTEVLRQQQPGANHNASPPTRDSSPAQKGVASTLVAPIKSPYRLLNRMNSNPALGSERSVGTSQDAERSLTDYIHHLENVQQRLGAVRPVSNPNLAPPPREDRRSHSQVTCSPNMTGYRQRWLKENRTWLYLSCLSPIYLYGPDSPALLPYTKKSDRR